MYKIRDFSRKIGISTQTLRYYDKINLFKPSYNDTFTGYRYYEESQIPKLKLVIDLKSFGLSLKEIIKYINTKDINILLNQKKGFENKVDKINKFIKSNQEKNVYNIRQSNYEEYVIINGTRVATSPQGLEVRDKNAKYYIIEKNNEFFDDFCVFSNSNWLTLYNHHFLDDQLLNEIVVKIKTHFEFVICYIPIKEKQIIDKIKERFSNCIIESVKQETYEYKKINIYLNTK